MQGVARGVRNVVDKSPVHYLEMAGDKREVERNPPFDTKCKRRDALKHKSA